MSPNPKGVTDWADEAARQFAESASGVGLKVSVEAVADMFRQIETVDIDLAGIERVYSTEEAAQFLGRSPQWMYWALKPRADGGGGRFCYPDGSSIEPERLGRKGIRRYSLKIIQEMGVSMHQHATINFEELKAIVRRVQLARMGRWQPVSAKKPGKRKRKTKTKTEAPTPHGTDSQGPA